VKLKLDENIPAVFRNPVVRFLKVAFRGEEEDDLH
jgi:hypothetical protein